MVITRKGMKTKAGAGKQRPMLAPSPPQASKHQIISESLLMGRGQEPEERLPLFGTRKRLRVEGGAGILRKTLGVLTPILNTR